MESCQPIAQDQMHDLVGDGLELAIRIGALKDSDLVATRIASNLRVLCASPEYLRRQVNALARRATER